MSAKRRSFARSCVDNSHFFYIKCACTSVQRDFNESHLIGEIVFNKEARFCNDQLAPLHYDRHKSVEIFVELSEKIFEKDAKLINLDIETSKKTSSFQFLTCFLSYGTTVAVWLWREVLFFSGKFSNFLKAQSIRYTMKRYCLFRPKGDSYLEFSLPLPLLFRRG